MFRKSSSSVSSASLSDSTSSKSSHTTSLPTISAWLIDSDGVLAERNSYSVKAILKARTKLLREMVRISEDEESERLRTYNFSQAQSLVSMATSMRVRHNPAAIQVIAEATEHMQQLVGSASSIKEVIADEFLMADIYDPAPSDTNNHQLILEFLEKYNVLNKVNLTDLNKMDAALFDELDHAHIYDCTKATFLIAIAQRLSQLGSYPTHIHVAESNYEIFKTLSKLIDKCGYLFPENAIIHLHLTKAHEQKFAKEFSREGTGKIGIDYKPIIKWLAAQGEHREYDVHLSKRNMKLDTFGPAYDMRPYFKNGTCQEIDVAQLILNHKSIQTQLKSKLAYPAQLEPSGCFGGFFDKKPNSLEPLNMGGASRYLRK